MPVGARGLSEYSVAPVGYACHDWRMKQPMAQQQALPVWSLGDRLGKARRFADLTQDQMAHRFRIGRRSIARYEASDDPPRPIVLSYSAITGVPLWWFDDAPRSDPAFIQQYAQHSRVAPVPSPRILIAA